MDFRLGAFQLPLSRCVKLTLNGVETYYAAPDDGRDLEDLTIGDLQYWPAVDAMMQLYKIVDNKIHNRSHSRLKISYCLAVGAIGG